MAIAKTPRLKPPAGPQIDKWMPEYQGKKDNKMPVRRGNVKQKTKKV